MVKVLFLLAVVAALTPGAQAANLCDMSEAEANGSPDCLRYHLECKAEQPTGKGGKNYVSPLLKDLSAKDLLDLSRQSSNALIRAEILSYAKTCQQYSYSEAYHAYLLKAKE